MYQCLWCGKEVIQNSKKEKKYCDKKCYKEYISKRDKEEILEAQRVRWRIKQDQKISNQDKKTCKNCGSIIQPLDDGRYASNNIKFCSKKCRKASYRDNEEYKTKASEYQKNNRDKINKRNKENNKTEIGKYRIKIYSLRFYYDLTEEEYRSMVDAQKGCCAICGDSLDDPHIDHCHKKEIIRGVLCHHCNVALGSFRDSTENLQKAINYLNVEKQEVLIY